MITNTELHKSGNVFPGMLTSFTHVVDTLIFNSDNGVILQVQVLRDSVLRFKYGTGGKMEDDFSYAIDEGGNRGYNKLKVTEEEAYYEITTSKIVCQIAKIWLETQR